MHKLLERQLHRYFGPDAAVPQELSSFVEAIDEAYQEADADRALLEHSMETVSDEMVERFQLLQDALSESDRARDALRDALSLVEATLEATAEGILVVDNEGEIVRTNRKLEELWDLADDQVAEGGRGLDLVLDRLEDPSTLLERVQEIARDPESESFDVLHLTDGRVVECSSMPQRVGGRTAGRVWSFRDVTERLSLEDQLRQAQKMEAIGSLAGGIAHDFNNLLTVIQGHSELLHDEETLSDLQREDMEEIIRATRRGADLTRQLLAFSRKQILQPTVIDLGEVVGDLEPMLRRLIGPDVEIDAKLDPDVPSILADRSQIEQVLVNLVVNARDAMPDGGRVAIETESVFLDEGMSAAGDGVVSSEPYVSLTVSDTGEGMSKQVRERIFEPFFTTKEAGKGTGLGLATVYGIVKQSEGHITVESEEGRGTTFRIFLPPGTAEPESAGWSEGPAGVARGSGTILVTEDEPSVRRFVCRALELQGYDVLEAATGTEAVRIAGQHPGKIDLLLTDMVMPGMTGGETGERVREERSGLRLLYMSGHTDEEVVRRGALTPNVSLLQKPFSVAELAKAVKKALGR